MSSAIASDVGVLRLERTIRHVVYLTAGLVLLAFGIPMVLAAATSLVQCYGPTGSCVSGPVFFQAFIAGYYANLAGGIAIVVIAVVLLMMARAVYRLPLPTEAGPSA